MTINKIDLLHLPGIEAFSTLRGTLSEPRSPYSGFNTCHYVNDSPGHVQLCRNALRDMVKSRAFIFPRQTHSSHVAVIDSYAPTLQQPSDVDAIVTALPDIALCIHTADCVPLVLADTEAGIIAAVHSGWKGTVARIAAAAVSEMCRLGATPSHIKAAMGPCIGPECFEVGPEVVEQFSAAGFPSRTIVTGHAKPHIDLPAAIIHTLAECGVAPEAITAPPACSRCNPQRFCSARATGTDSARTLTLIHRTASPATDQKSTPGHSQSE